MFISFLSIFFFTKTSLGSIACSDRLLPGLSDDKITASSMFTTMYQPSRARLNSTSGFNWCSHSDDRTPYIQVKMNATTVVGIITQGSNSLPLWVKSYHVRYSEDGNNWKFVKESGDSKKVFIGNSDQNTCVTNKFSAGIRLKFLRIYPIEWEMSCCLRFDVIGCQATDVMTVTAKAESVKTLNTSSEEIQATPIIPAISAMTTSAMAKSAQELTTFTEEIQATPNRPATDVMTTTAMTESVQELTMFTDEIQASPTRYATGVMTTTAMTESVQELTMFTDEIQASPTIYAPFVMTTMKFLPESTESEYMSLAKKELSTLSDLSPFASSTSSTQSMASMSPTNCSETLNERNTTTEPRCYMVCSKNHTEQELVEMIDRLKKELRTDKKKTSMYIRSKTSASDERKSAAAIGRVGVAILCAVGIGILLLDLPQLLQFFKHIKVNKNVTPAVRT